MDRPGIIEPDNALEGFADEIYNLIGLYEKDGIGFRLAYNYRGEHLINRTPDYTEPYGQLDFSASYDFNESVTVMFEGTNLTNETQLQYLGQRDRVGLVELSGARYNLGIRATF